MQNIESSALTNLRTCTVSEVLDHLSLCGTTYVKQLYRFLCMYVFIAYMDPLSICASKSTLITE